MAAFTRSYRPPGGALMTSDLGKQQQDLLNLVDKLKYAQLDNVKLPQIIAVGNQSSGKSSVLEAITGIPFPRHADACTRFPTEIRLRRSNEESSTVSIIPDKKNRSPQEQDRLRRFHASVDTPSAFAEIMARAVHEIAPKNIPGRFAAGDVLVIDKRGPDLPLLTVVDLPGLVRIENKDQCSADLAAIEEITDRYMKSSRAIILAVISGNEDYTQAPILQKARKYDETGERTIGVLTKPDLTDWIGLEDKFLALVNNQDKYYQLELGWYVLRNPGRRDDGEPWPSAEERQQSEEAFFSTGKWSTLPSRMCGATSLKQALSVQLQRHIGRYLPKLQSEVQQAYNTCLAELKQLGPGKDTVEEMREELLQQCSKSKELVTAAVQATYANPKGESFFPTHTDPNGTPIRNLRARAVEENKVFAERIRSDGRTYRFTDDSPQTIGRNSADLPTKVEFARDFVAPFIHQNTGLELPTDHPPAVVYKLFQTQSQNWSNLAQQHKTTMGVICNQFLKEVIDFHWPQRMREPLWDMLLEPKMSKMLQEAQDEATRLGQDLSLEVRPYTDEYEARLTQWRLKASTGSPLTTAEEVLEKMLIYYELTEKTFVQNVIVQVVERHLLQCLQDIFESVQVTRMSEETIEAIAAENQATRNKRKELMERKVSIEESLDICARLAMQKELREARRNPVGADYSSDDDSGARRASQRMQPMFNSYRKPFVESASPASSPTPPRERPPSRTGSRMSTATTHVSGGFDPRMQADAASVLSPEPPLPARPPKIQVESNGMSGGWEPTSTGDHNPFVARNWSPYGAAHAPPPAHLPPGQPPGYQPFPPTGQQMPLTPPASAGSPAAPVHPAFNTMYARESVNGSAETPEKKPRKTLFKSR